MIEVGEYVRTTFGSIGQVIKYEGQILFVTKNHWSVASELIKDKYIKSHSKNIIDLIEVGDYVNGYYVEKVWEQVNYRMAIDLRGSYLGLSDDKFIKSIVTKESFKNAEYRVETN